MEWLKILIWLQLAAFSLATLLGNRIGRAWREMEGDWWLQIHQYLCKIIICLRPNIATFGILKINSTNDNKYTYLHYINQKLQITLPPVVLLFDESLAQWDESTELNRNLWGMSKRFLKYNTRKIFLPFTQSCERYASTRERHISTLNY